MSEFLDRLTAEIVSVKTRIADSPAASAELPALRARLAELEETKRQIEQQSHGG